MQSDLAADERIDFFTTSGSLLHDGTRWRVPIRGRVYRPVRSTARKAIIEQAIELGLGVVPDRNSRTRFDDRINLLLSDNKGGRSIVIDAGGQRFVLPKSGADGHFSGEIEIAASGASGAGLDGRLTFKAVLQRRDPRLFSGMALLLRSEGRSIISDIDDTVKITHVTDKARMLKATFVDEFEAVPGMARAFRGWVDEGAALHFVSSTPWHLYRPIDAFLDAAGFPKATFALKKIRLKDRSILDIFADATKTKPPEIEALLAAYPKRTFVLVGDSGEKDPEIYADFLRRYPTAIERVMVRNVTGGTANDARFASVFEGIDSGRWQLFSEATELPASLR